jgi:hypothetical protein
LLRNFCLDTDARLKNTAFYPLVTCFFQLLQMSDNPCRSYVACNFYLSLASADGWKHVQSQAKQIDLEQFGPLLDRIGRVCSRTPSEPFFLPLSRTCAGNGREISRTHAHEGPRHAQNDKARTMESTKTVASAASRPKYFVRIIGGAKRKRNPESGERNIGASASIQRTGAAGYGVWLGDS